MSPSMRVIEDVPAGFPRVSGDEPAVALMAMHLVQFSPRERG